MNPSELVATMCATIDRCGENLPLTSWLLAMSVGIELERAEELLTAVEERTGKIQRHLHHGRTIWIRPEQLETWTSWERRKRWTREFASYYRCSTTTKPLV